MDSNSKEKKAWHEDENFWKGVYPILFSKERWRNTPEEVEKVITLLNLTPGCRILDLCCGPGRHSLELAARGFHVTGVDRIAFYLKKAKEKADSQGLNIELIEDRMEHFLRPGFYDTVLSLLTSFGYFEDPKDDQLVLINIHSSLKKGGKLLMDLMGKEVMARIFQERDWHEENGTLILEERKVSNDWSWSENRWIVIKGETRKDFRFAHRIYSAVELSALLKECGFKSVHAYGDLGGSPYGHEARRLIIVAEK